MKPAAQFRILVVDDTEANRYALTRILQRAGYHVVEAATGRDALEMIRQDPDLVILDVKLPDINGTEVSRMVRSDPSTAHIPILHVSATFTLSSDKAKGLDAGADGYLASPIEPEELLAHIRMLLRLRETQQALARSNDWLKTVLSQIIDVYFALDNDWRFVEVNPPAEKFFGRPAAALLGQNFFEAFPQSSFGHHYRAARAQMRTVHFEGESVIRPNSWWEGHIYPREDRLDIYLRDISDRKRHERQLRENAAQLERHVLELQNTQNDLARARDQLSRQNELLELKVRERTAKLEETIHDLETFSYSITHDMRAPLRAMHSFTRILLETAAPKLVPEERELFDRIVNSAARLDMLIRDVLSYSNIVRTRLPLVPVDLEKLLHDIVREYPGFQPPQAEIVVQSPLPPVLANEAFLTQCLSNLLGNAVKFVAPGVVPRIRVQGERKDGMVRLCIRDNGIGIPPDHRKNLFALFHRAQTAYPGTGIGLAVVRKAAERMNGTAELVESVPGQGSTFCLQLQEVPGPERSGNPAAREQVPRLSSQVGSQDL